MQILPGSAYPLGATADNEATGVNFALFSEHAERVELCLYDGPEGDRERRTDAAIGICGGRGSGPGGRRSALWADACADDRR